MALIEEGTEGKIMQERRTGIRQNTRYPDEYTAPQNVSAV